MSERSAPVAIRPTDPRHPYPIGWFHVVPSSDLLPGSVVERTFLGQQVVAFRTEAGTAAVVAAHCPHLGANLGRGGSVVGEAIRCPFHGLRWSVDGTCTAPEYPGAPEYAGRITTFPTIERFGFVFAWHDPAGGPPAFDVPDLDLDGWTDVEVTTISIRTHVESVHENGVDVAHFASVHGFTLSGGCFEDRGTSFHSDFHFAVPGFLRDGPSELWTFFDTDVFGLGCARSENSAAEAGLRYRVLLLPTPTTDGYIDFTIATTVRRPPDGDLIAGTPVSVVADIMHRGAVGGVEQDIPIWEGLQYVERPRLVKGDGPVPRFRRWARQFTPGAGPTPSWAAPG
jgi:nitrite reductase/ring-hydroxylating ferredoxin subunit